ncbi:hypothetical protein [Brevundimonas denitrificans]|nr:hypothetical protein [Brevundimonas denitrificans]
MLAARFLRGSLTARPSCPPRVAGSNVGGGDPVRPEIRAATRRARGKRLRGAVRFVETVKQSNHRARPGRSAPSPNFPAAMPESANPCLIERTTMARRRRSPRLTDREFIRSLQLIRLKGLLTGEYQPMSNREEMYLRLLRAGLPADIEDFVISRPLFHLEAMERKAVEEDLAAPPST